MSAGLDQVITGVILVGDNELKGLIGLSRIVVIITA